MADPSSKLEKELDELIQLFTVDTARLKKIAARFEEELYLGLSRISRCLLPGFDDEDSDGSIPMNVTYIQGWPTGEEQGQFLTLDLGEKDLRICWVTLNEKSGETAVDQQTYPVPEQCKKGQAESLWSFLVDSIITFLNARHILEKYSNGEKIRLGFTFSFPVTQEEIDHGVLQTWTKGFDVKGIEGHDVAAQLREAIQQRNLPIELVALVNDTTGAMIASRYRDPQVVIGAIFGGGCNAAYFEHCGDISKIAGLPQDQLMAINCEYGAFDNEHLVLPRTPYDIQLDEESPRPGEQAFEKMSAGLYLGELLRLAMLDLHKKGVLLQNHDISKLHQAYILDTTFLSNLENDNSPDMKTSLQAMQQLVSISPPLQELEALRRLAEAIAIRGARLCCCGIAAICRKKNIESGHVAADGSILKQPNFKQRFAEALGEVLDWPTRSQDPIIITKAEDGSGIGTAVISAMAPSWPKQKERRASRQRQSISGAEM